MNGVLTTTNMEWTYILFDSIFRRKQHSENSVLQSEKDCTKQIDKFCFLMPAWSGGVEVSQLCLGFYLECLHDKSYCTVFFMTIVVLTQKKVSTSSTLGN